MTPHFGSLARQVGVLRRRRNPEWDMASYPRTGLREKTGCHVPKPIRHHLFILQIVNQGAYASNPQ